MPSHADGSEDCDEAHFATFAFSSSWAASFQACGAWASSSSFRKAWNAAAPKDSNCITLRLSRPIAASWTAKCPAAWRSTPWMPLKVCRICSASNAFLTTSLLLVPLFASLEAHACGVSVEEQLTWKTNLLSAWYTLRKSIRPAQKIDTTLGAFCNQNASLSLTVGSGAQNASLRIMWRQIVNGGPLACIDKCRHTSPICLCGFPSTRINCSLSNRNTPWSPTPPLNWRTNW